MKEEYPFSKVSQIGVIVKDMERAVKHYESLGIGPFRPLKNIATKERKILGKKIDPNAFKLQVLVARLGSVDLELIQPVEGDSLWKEFLDKKGEGINHLGFFVDDIEKEEAKLADKGLPVLYSTRFQGGGGAAYFDSGKIGGVLFELIQWPPEA